MITHLGAGTDIGELVRAAQAEGRTVHVVPAGVDKDTTLLRFGEALEFPTWFGRNLDALDESLRDLAASVGGPWDLVWDGTAVLRAEDERTYAVVSEILDDIASEHPGMRVLVVDR